MFSTMYSNFTICGFYKNSNIINLNKSKNLESSVNFSIFIIPVKRKAYFWVRSESEENKNTCLCIQINEFSIQSMPESLKKHSQTAFFSNEASLLYKNGKFSTSAPHTDS